MVRAQESLLEHLGIKKLLCATGGSMGGMQLLQFCATFPDKAFSAIPIACSSSHSAQNIALNELLVKQLWLILYGKMESMY